MNLLDRIKARKSCLKSCETTVTTISGHSYVEKILADGSSVISQPQVSTSPGYVIDMKPDLQVAQVLPGLCMGSQDVAHDLGLLKNHSVTHILSLGIKPTMLDHKLNYTYVHLLDLPETNLINSLDQCFTFIDNARQLGGCVFIHCNAGISRSASVVIAYLMRKESMNYEQAFIHLRNIRPVIKPNPGFVQQLKDYEKMILNHCE